MTNVANYCTRAIATIQILVGLGFIWTMNIVDVHVPTVDIEPAVVESNEAQSSHSQ
jgi:hypothetical protein